jgi:hypothetical protein
MMRSRIRLLGWSLPVLLPCLFAAGLCPATDKIEGKPELVAPFFGSFDSPMYPIQLTLR